MPTLRSEDGPTWCNIYATDYCYLAGLYLPRVWWTAKALAAIVQGNTPPVAYDQTVRETRADDLYQWLLDSGAQFGWRRVFDGSAGDGWWLGKQFRAVGFFIHD